MHRLDFGNAIPGGNGAYYAKLDSDDLVLKMDRSKIESLFLKLSDLTDLSFPPIAKDDVTQLALMRNGQKYRFEWKDGAWMFASPGLEERVHVDEADKMLTALTQLKPQDEAIKGGTEVTGVNRAKAIVELTMKDGAKHTVFFGNEAPLTDGARFVKFDGGPQVYTISRYNYEESVPEPGDLFDLALADWDPADVSAIRLTDASGELALAKAAPEEATSSAAADKWIVEGQGSEAVPAESTQAFLSTIGSMIAGNVVLQPKDTGLEQPSWSVELTLQDGENYRLDIGGMQGTWSYYAKLKGEDTVFLLDAKVGNRLMALGRDLRSKEVQ